MKCAWKELLDILPSWIRGRLPGPNELLEIRLRTNRPPEFVTVHGSVFLEGSCSRDALNFVVNTASRYSPWSSWTSSRGYITAPGGHRVGLCGIMTVEKGHVGGVREVSSVCIRVAKEFPGIGRQADLLKGSILLVGKPGSGKTTLLRDLIRRRSEAGPGSICVVDEKGELFPSLHGKQCFDSGPRTDVLTGCPKAWGLEAAIRNMSPAYIAVDEITAQEDCTALLNAAWCGVKLIATAHADNQEELYTRPIYKPLCEGRIFDTLLVLNQDKSWHQERMRPWNLS